MNAIDKTAVKPSVLYIFLGSIFAFAMLMFVSSCTKEKDPTPIESRVSITNFSPESGAEGTVVVIVGTNFNANIQDNKVSFGGTEAIVSEASATSLTVTVPPGATTGKILVTVNTKDAESATDFTIL